MLDPALRVLVFGPGSCSALALLGAHCKHHHVDRHFDTHVMAYAVGGGRHVLVNSHPVFADAAHIVGTVNESPPDAAPTLESSASRSADRQLPVVQKAESSTLP